MARKSNKTAHVLNLLAGHDNQSNPDETIETTSAEAETPAEMSASESPAPADSETPAASTPQVQNISVIDTTGEDPVADLIQQKLSAQFDEPVSDVSDQSDVSDESDPPEASGADDAVISAEAESGIDASSVTAEPPASEAVSEAAKETASKAVSEAAKETASEAVSEAAKETASEAADADTSVTPSALSEADSAAAPDAADSFSMEAASDNVTVPPRPRHRTLLRFPFLRRSRFLLYRYLIRNPSPAPVLQRFPRLRRRRSPNRNPNRILFM